MKRTPFAAWPCSVARTVDLIGDWWTPLVLREAFLGTRRFEAMQKNLGIGRNVLTQRLRRLTDEGMLERVRYQERPARWEYVLTRKGKDFFPVIAAMVRWGDRWLAGPAGPPVVLRHTACGEQTEPQVVCSKCHEPLTLEQVRASFGPGFPKHLRPVGSAQTPSDAPATRNVSSRST